MSSENRHVIENSGPESSGTDHDERDWENAARSALTELLGHRKRELAGAVGRMENHMWGLNDSDLTADDVDAFRGALYNIQRLVEEDIVPLVDGIEPYQRANTNLSAGQLVDFLDLYWDHVQKLPRKSGTSHESSTLSASDLYFGAQLEKSDFLLDPEDIDEIEVRVRVEPQNVVLDLEGSNEEGEQASSVAGLTPNEADDIGVQLLQAAERKREEDDG